MKGWTLSDVRGLDVHDYDEILDWLRDEAKQASGDQSIDMDAYVNAKAMKATGSDDEWEE